MVLDEQLGIGVAQPHRSGTDYPFIEKHGDVPEILLDAYVQYSPKLHRLPLSMQGTLGITAAAVNLDVLDKNGNHVISLNPSTQVAQNAWGTFYLTLTYQYQNTLATIVLGTGTGVGTGNGIASGTLLSSKLDPRACVPQQATVTEITFRNLREQAPVTKVDLSTNVQGPGVDIRAGYNVQIRTPGLPARQASGNRLPLAITVGAIGGAGLGQPDACQSDDPELRTINQASAPTGEFSIATDSCFRVEPVVTRQGDLATIAAGQLRLAQDCLPCCDCDDYLSVTNAVTRVTRSSRVVLGTLLDSKDAYQYAHGYLESLYQEWTFPLHISVQRSSDCILAVAVGYNNTTEIDLINRFVEISFDEIKDNQRRAAQLVARSHLATLYTNNIETGVTQYTHVAPNRIQIPIGTVKKRTITGVSFAVRIDSQEMLRLCLVSMAQPNGNFACTDIQMTCSEAAIGFNPYVVDLFEIRKSQRPWLP